MPTAKKLRTGYVVLSGPIRGACGPRRRHGHSRGRVGLMPHATPLAACGCPAAQHASGPLAGPLRARVVPLCLRSVRGPGAAPAAPAPEAAKPRALALDRGWRIGQMGGPRNGPESRAGGARLGPGACH